MGIHGLKKLIGQHAPKAVELKPPSALIGMKVAVDTSICCYQIGSVARNAQSNAAQWRSFRRLAISRCEYFKKLNMTPIFVFDGPPPAIKDYELGRRRALASANNAQPIVTNEHFDVLRKIILAHGFQCVDAPAEAEAQCARMCREGIVDAVITEDGDALTFGAHMVIFGFNNSARHVTIITLRHVLDGLKLDMDGFIDLCILLGCDYGPTLVGIGPVHALKYMQQYGSVTKMLQAKSITVSPGFHWIMPHHTFTDHETAPVHILAPPSDPAYIENIKQTDTAAANAEKGVFDDEDIA
jgi:flap endonuclease-1